MENNEDQLMQNTSPNVEELRKDFRRSYSDQRLTHRVREADETRFASWAGQSRDGKKHSKDIGAQAFPWEGASDTRIRLADEICGFNVNLCTSAVSRAALNVSGIESSDHEKAGAIGVYLRWLTGVLLHPDWEEELELHSEYAAQFGWSVLHISWERSTALVPREINLTTLAGFLGIDSPEQFEALTAGLQDSQEMLADMLSAGNPGLTRAKALKHLKEVSETGTTTFEVPEQVKNQPVIVALKPYHEILFPPETTDWHRARCMFRRDHYTVAEVEAKSVSGEWNKDFCEAVKQTAGQNAQVWDYGLSPVTNNTSQIDEKQHMIEVVHGYSRRITDTGEPGIYLTVFSPYIGHSGGEKELFGVHELVQEVGDRYPFEVYTREKTRRSPIESRGVAELVRTWQNEYKAQADQVFDRSTFDTLPPFKVPLRYGQRIKLGPGVQVAEQRPGDISWLEPPRRGTEGAFQLMEHIERRADRYFGRFNNDLPEVETQLKQQTFVHRWLRHLSTVLNRVWTLCQRFDDDERFAQVTGTGQPIPKDRNKFNFQLSFDVRELDNEFVEKKLQAISQFVLPEDTMGIVDRTKLIRRKLQVIDPTLAAELVTEQGEASQKMFDDMNSQVAYMSLGNQPKFVENDPTAKVKLQFMQQILQNNPKYQQQLQQDESFQQLLEAFSQNLNMSIMQQENKQTGRIGVKPNGQ